LAGFGMSGPIAVGKQMLGQIAGPSAAAGQMPTGTEIRNLGLKTAVMGPVAAMLPEPSDIKGMAGQAGEAAKFYGPELFGGMPRVPTPYKGLPVGPTIAPSEKELKGTIGDPGVRQAIKEAAPRIGGFVAGLAVDEILFRAGPPIAKKVVPPTVRGAGRAIAGAGKIAQENPFLVGGPAGAVFGKGLGHPYVGYMAGASAAKSVGKWMQRVGERIASRFPSQVDKHLGPIPGTGAFKAQEAAVATVAPKLLTAGTPEVGQKAGGMLLREPTRLDPNYAKRSAAFVREINPPDLKTEAAITHGSHAIPDVTAYADKVGVDLSSMKAVKETWEAAMDAEWIGQKSKFVAPIADVKIPITGVAEDIGKSFSSAAIATDSNLANALANTKKFYTQFKAVNVESLFDRVTGLNRELRTRLSPAERAVKQAEADALRPRLYAAYNKHLPPELMDQAILSRKRYGSMHELWKPIEKAYGGWLKDSAAEPGSKQFAKAAAQDAVVKRIFEHQKAAPPPAMPGPGTAQLNKQMGITPQMEKAAAPAKPSIQPMAKPASAPAKVVRGQESPLSKLSLGELRELQKNAHDAAVAGLIKQDRFMELAEPIQVEIDKRLGAKPTTVSESFAETGRGKALIKPSSEATTAGRREAMRTAGATQQEQQLGGGRRTKKPIPEGSF